MFTSVLVANRGEIACRIFRTAKQMGMATVAVYSDADAKAKHVREADQAVRLGPAPAAESYLRGDLIIAAAQQTGAQAIHPGYGFLSENPEFAESVVAAGLIWIGPTPSAIRAMGLKDEAKRIAIEAGVPVLEGYQGEDQSEKRLLKAAKDIGFPVLIKAVAGGGGRGIREVLGPDDFKGQLAAAQREAKAAFGNDVVLIERLVQRPRHIEVQVFGDKHGNIVHLFERDCSLQRRRQKVIEEAPAPGMTEEVRAAMTDAAVKLARAVSYENAGTVEFIVDGNGPLRPDGFWFLEMNTRLQVEHPVTEMITGEDLVEWQVRVAAGEKLPKSQEQLHLNGHAIEARICAENPAEGFRPSVGRISRCRWPRAFSAESAIVSAVRVDAGFAEGDHVPSQYDSLLAKIIVWTIDSDTRDAGGDRGEALQMLRRALGDVQVLGCVTNAHFLFQCLAPEGAFALAGHHVGWIAEGLDSLINAEATQREAAALLARSMRDRATNEANPWTVPNGWRLNSSPRLEWRLESAGQVFVVDLAGESAVVNEAAIGVRLLRGNEFERMRTSVGDQTIVFLDGAALAFSLPGAFVEHLGLEGGDEVKAPLPGKLVGVSVSAGQTVRKGDGLVLLEAMKMEHTLKAPRDGVVADVAALVGSQVKEGAVLVRLAPLDGVA